MADRGIGHASLLAQFGNAVVVPVVEALANAMQPYIAAAVAKSYGRSWSKRPMQCRGPTGNPPLHMADIVAAEVRSRMMSGIRSKNTKPEMILRQGLHAAGF